ncbi:MAG: alanine--tRNA ligase [Verrucomicrobia bacterium]|nr:alanine--tRNA ligase [Verrucomicrobiota bacterium]MDA1067575.1 alanine--tRNA ligase [Verrucomicrobiota bacterium]
MTSSEIRQSFLDFFQSKGHEIVPSAPLLPTAPNLLFTNAGMNPFVPYFLGERTAVHTRIADSQKCIRAGGKHNDLEDVGFDTYHQTFFEMLGNWSFGDYFKEKAITWAWELLTEVWKFPKERLYASVYKPGEDEPANFDQEAYNYWKAIFEKEGLDPEVHIVYGDKKDNFWMMGETGPCGPCSEIHIDLTPNADTKGSLVNKDSPLCIEIWNLVFIQFNATPLGTFIPLSSKHVDTGMGFERVCGIMGTTKNFTDFSQPPANYNCDLFLDVFVALTELSGKVYQATIPVSPQKMTEQESIDVAFRVIADHIRTLSCSIADGILPGNEGRNYVLRRILRRAIMFGNQLGLRTGFFEKLVTPVVEKLGPVYPELVEQKEIIERIIRSEEESFGKTLDRGLALLDRVTRDGSGVITGKAAFTLYDTYGFPLDLTQLIARERGLEVDIPGFEKAMKEQRKRSQDAQKKSIIEVAGNSDEDATDFVGYDIKNLNDYETTVQKIISQDGDSTILLARTPFYAEMGGQVGDIGILKAGPKTFKIVDTTRDAHGHILHKIEGEVNFIQDEQVIVSVDAERRLAIQRNHSATHLMHHALREVLGTHIRQAGSLVEPNRLRFDFNHFEAVTADQLHEVERIVNELVYKNSLINWYEVPFDDKPENVIAQFGEKYGDIVRVVDIGQYSLELCAGTHARATGEVGFFKILSESAIAAGTRRIEAIVGEASFNFIEEQIGSLSEVSQKLSCPPAEINQRLENLLKEKAALEKELKKFQQKASANKATDLADNATDRDGLKWVVKKVQAGNPNDMRTLAVQISKSIGEGVVVLAGVFGDKITILALSTPQAIEAGHKAGDIVMALTGQLGGSGGGKPDFAMGGAKDIEGLDAALSSI